MKVIIAGSRSIDDYAALERAVRESGFKITEVVSGTAYGVDLLGEAWAMQNAVAIRQFYPAWNLPDGRVDKGAGIKRNMQMGRYADALIALWDGKSKGTKHMVEFMRKLNKPVYLKEVKIDE